MGFFGKADPLAELTALAQKRPKDVKVALDLAAMLKAKGAQSSAIEQYMRAVDLFVEQGFAHKAVAVVKQVIGMNPSVIEAHEFLVKQYENSNLKEETRATLKTLVRLYTENGRIDDAGRARDQISALGPGR